MEHTETKTDSSYYYQKPTDTRPLFAGGGWSDARDRSGMGIISTDMSRTQTAEEFLQIRADQKMGKFDNRRSYEIYRII